MRQKKMMMPNVVEFKGKKYCMYFGMICTKHETENAIHYIEAMLNDDDDEKEVMKLLNTNN